MTRIRPQSLSGLLSAALLLIVLPLTAALVYGGVQLRDLSRTSDVLVRDSITLTQHTQRLFQDITAMERKADVYGVLNDPRVARAFEANYVVFSETLRKLADYVPGDRDQRGPGRRRGRRNASCSAAGRAARPDRSSATSKR